MSSTSFVIAVTRTLDAIRLLLRSYSHILFIDNEKLGFLIFLITFLHPNIAISGVISVTAAYLLLRLFEYGRDFSIDTIYLYNPLLVGLFIGYLFNLDTLAVTLIILSSWFTLIVTFILGTILRSFQLPILSLPFTLVAVLVAIASKGYSNLIDATYYFSNTQISFGAGLPAVVLTFLKSVGAIFCIPDPVAGLLILSASLFFSPLIVIFFFFGHCLGYVMEWLLVIGGHPLDIRYHYFNYSLVFASLAGVFLLPSAKSLLIAAVGALMTALIATASLSFWSFFQIPILALPFNVIVLSLLHAVWILNPTKVNLSYEGSPERNIDYAFLRWLRFRSNEVGVFTPFDSKWSVLQGFFGEWTHRGKWAHALDFVIKDEKGSTYSSDGAKLQDYYAFDKPVLSPVDGYVIETCSTLEDNAPTTVETQENWGNHVTIRTLGGIYILLAHLKKESLQVKTGDYVQVGKQLGLCGNSGYSPEPHLHLQVQLSPDLGAPTIGFHLLNYTNKEQLFFHGVPKKSDTIEPLPSNIILKKALSFKIDQELLYAHFKDGHKVSTLKITNRLNPLTGQHYLTDGHSKIEYGRYGTVFFFDGFRGKKGSILFDLFASCPRIPMIYGEESQFIDYLPFSFQIKPSRLFEILKLVLLGQIYPKNSYSINPTDLTIKGTPHLFSRPTKTYCKLDPSLGFIEFEVGNRRYVRTD